MKLFKMKNSFPVGGCFLGYVYLLFKLVVVQSLVQVHNFAPADWVLMVISRRILC